MRKILALAFTALLLVACGQGTVQEPSAPWTPPQDEIVEVAQTLTCADATTEPNQWLAFRRDVTLDAVPASAPARIAVDSSTGCG